MTFASSRSRSNTEPSVFRISVRSMVCETICATASSRASISDNVDGGSQETRPQQSAAHPGAGLIENVDQCRFAALPRKQRLDQFQIANRYRIQDHRARAVVIRGPVEMVERASLRIAQVMQNRAGRPDGERSSSQSAAIQAQQLEMLAERALGIIVIEDPSLELGPQALGFERRMLSSCSTSRTFRVSSAGATSCSSTSVTRNSPVETSTCASPARPFRRATAAR